MILIKNRPPYACASCTMLPPDIGKKGKCNKWNYQNALSIELEDILHIEIYSRKNVYKKDIPLKARFNIKSRSIVKITRSTVDVVEEEKFDFCMKHRMEDLRLRKRQRGSFTWGSNLSQISFSC